MAKRLIHPTDVQYHGSYIRDNKRWRLQREITRREAADLVKMPKELWSNDYMWDNKGYIVIGKPYKIHDLTIGDGEISELVLESGDQAVDINDGKYRLFVYE